MKYAENPCAGDFSSLFDPLLFAQTKRDKKYQLFVIHVRYILNESRQKNNRLFTQTKRSANCYGSELRSRIRQLGVVLILCQRDDAKREREARTKRKKNPSENSERRIPLKWERISPLSVSAARIRGSQDK